MYLNCFSFVYKCLTRYCNLGLRTLIFTLCYGFREIENEHMYPILLKNQHVFLIFSLLYRKFKYGWFRLCLMFYLIPPVYLIVKLFWINRMLIRLDNCCISIGPFIYPLSCFINSQNPCYSLNTGIRPMFCCTPWILVFVPTPNPLEIFHPWLRHWGSKTMVYQLSIEKKN
jgi:hypothetical protein